MNEESIGDGESLGKCYIVLNRIGDVPCGSIISVTASVIKTGKRKGWYRVSIEDDQEVFGTVFGVPYIFAPDHPQYKLFTSFGEAVLYAMKITAENHAVLAERYRVMCEGMSRLMGSIADVPGHSRP